MTRSRLEQLLKRFNPNPPAHADDIRRIQQELQFSIPDPYIAFLEHANGGEGFVGEAYLILWRLEELSEMNRAYEVAQNAPDLFLFGSDGGGEGLGFDMRLDARPVISVPFIGMNLETARPIAPNFDSFLEVLFST